MSTIFTPINIGPLVLENRLVRSATWDNTADDQGTVTEASIEMFRKLATGNIGLIITGHAFVSQLGQATPGQYGIHSDEMMPGLSKLTGMVHSCGAKIAVQITHCGFNSGFLRRKGLPVQVVSVREGSNVLQKQITEEEVESIIDDFVSASVRGVKAGFDAVQLHGAHNYLMGQFLSPLANQRTDNWGGNAEKRRRFHIETIKRIRRSVGEDFPIIMKFGPEEDRAGGLSLSEGVETAKEMARCGLSAIEISTGGRNPIPREEKGSLERAYFRGSAAALKKELDIPVILVGGIRSMEMADEILESGDADIVSMCRPFIREPHLARRWVNGETKPATCISCNKCMPTGGNILSCGEDHK